MNKLLAMLILGLSFSGAALILSVPLLFKSKLEQSELVFAAGSAGAFSICCLMLSSSKTIQSLKNLNIIHH
ncbi:hypothetical protein [Bacillus safensis]|uniref:hypothetical protein n=1 Tax=Bacillus safensis TaxID=561879 RepID=UPI0020C15154|nr:hypothetical protein [Bacillus safensis]MCK8451490.1 hypothetical protein [Bacillus safensis]